VIGQVTVARYDAVTVVLPRIQFFGDVTLCQTPLNCLTMKVRASQSFEMLGATQPTTQCHIPKDMKLYVIFTELLKDSHFMVYCNETSVVSFVHAQLT
jgi:hypothetical protein